MKYYMYKMNYDKWITFENKEELINYFCYYVSNTWYSPKKECSLFKEINMNGNDYSIIRKSKSIYDEDNKYVCTHYWKEKEIKSIMVFDENNRIIDPRIFTKEILNGDYDKTKLPKRKINKAKRYNYSDIPYIYRHDPVPGISKSKWGYRNRRVRYRQMVREITTKETSKYIRQKKSDLGYDVGWRENPIRHIDKSWKNKKVRKQYMKNKKHF